MRSRLAACTAGALAIAVVTAYGASALNGKDRSVPVVLDGTAEGGPFGRETRRWSRDGLLMDYRPGKRFSLVMRIRFLASTPITLLYATTPEPRPALVRRIGQHFSLAPERPSCPDNARGCVPASGLRPPFGASVPKPLLVPPGRQVLVQFNFRMGGCRSFAPLARRTYNRTTRLRYSMQGFEGQAALDLTRFRITVIAPRAGRCHT